MKCWTLGGERERVRVYIYVYYTCTYALKLRKRRSTSSPSSFPVPLVSKTAPSVSLLWRFSSTSLPFLLSTSFQSRLTVPFFKILAVFALTQQPIFKTSKVSRIRIRIYHVNIAHAQSARRTRTEDGRRDGRTDARAVDIINGGARSRSPQ